MTEEPRPSRPGEVSRLLLKAVDQLPEKDRDVVLTYFVELGLGARASPLIGPLIHRTGQAGAPPGTLLVEDHPLASFFSGQKPIGPDQVLIPVRLSEAQHGRLKSWCAEHGFPMAVVVRGLIERFLDSREKDAR